MVASIYSLSATVHNQHELDQKMSQAVFPLFVSAIMHACGNRFAPGVEAYLSDIREPVHFLDLSGLELKDEAKQKLQKWFPTAVIYTKNNRPVSDSYYEPIFLQMIRYSLTYLSIEFPQKIALPEVARSYELLKRELQKLIDCRKKAAIDPFLQALPYLQPFLQSRTGCLDLQKCVPPAYQELDKDKPHLQQGNLSQPLPQNLQALHRKWASKIAAHFTNVDTLHWPFRLPIDAVTGRSLARMPIKSLHITFADKRDVKGLSYFSQVEELNNHTSAVSSIWRSPEHYHKAAQEAMERAPSIEEVTRFNTSLGVTAQFFETLRDLPHLRRLYLGASSTADDNICRPLQYLSLTELQLSFPKITIKTLQKINAQSLVALNIMRCDSFKIAEIKYIAERFKKLQKLYLSSYSTVAETVAPLVELPKLDALLLTSSKPFSVEDSHAITRCRKLRKLAVCSNGFDEKALAVFAGWGQLTFLHVEGSHIPESSLMTFRKLCSKVRFSYTPPDATAAATRAKPTTQSDRDEERDRDEKEEPQHKSSASEAKAIAEMLARFRKIEVSRLPHHLQKMSVDASFVRRLEAHIKKYPDLTEISLPNCELNTKVLQALSHLKKLTKIDATVCRGFDLREIVNYCPHLTTFHNELDDPYEALWMDPENADESRASYHSQFPENVEQLRALADFSVSDFMALTRLKKLRVLHLDSVQKLPAEVFTKLAQLEALEELHLNSLTFSPKETAVFRELPHLHTLNITHSPLQDEGLEEITRTQSKLRALYLATNGITDKGMCYLARLQELETFSLGLQEPITEKGFRELVKLKKLKRLLLVNTGNLSNAALLQIVQQSPSLETLHFVSASPISEDVLKVAASRKITVLQSSLLDAQEQVA